MRTGSLLAAVAVLFVAAPGPAADPPQKDAKPPKPAVVVQLQPAGRLIADAKELVRVAAGPKEGEAAVKRFVSLLEDKLGEKGFDGLDLNRPLAGYLVLREKADDTSFVVVAPYLAEDDFLALLDRLEFKTEAVPGKKGVFKLTPPDDLDFDNDSYLRLADGHAYLCFNGDDVLDPANLLPLTELIDPRETAQVVVRIYPDRITESRLEGWLDDVGDILDLYKMIFVPDDPADVAKGFRGAVDEVVKLLRRHADTTRKDAKDITLRFAADPLTGELSLELVVTPKPGTDLAKDVAAFKPGVNRFAGAIRPDAVAGIAGRIPSRVEELRDAVVALTEALDAATKQEAAEPIRPLATAVFEGIGRAAKKGDIVFALALYGPPPRGGFFTAVGGIAFDDPAAAEKALRDAAKNPLLKKVLKLDADKAGEFPVHTLAVGEFLPPGWQPMFGKDAVLCVAFGKDALYVSLGPAARALAALKSAVAAPAGAATASVWEVSGNVVELAKLVAVLEDEAEGKLFAERYGKVDKLVPMVSIAATGGERFTLRMTDNVKFLSRSLFLFEDDGGR